MISQPKKKRNYTLKEVETALAALIASTRRVNRKLNLGEVGKMLGIACEGLGSLNKVADTIGLSTQMLREFSRYEKLESDVKKLIDEGKIQSVDIMVRISRLPTADQLAVAKAVGRGILTSDDVRAIVSLRKALPQETITKVIDRVITSRNIKEYVIEFLIPEGEKSTKIKERFKKLLGNERIVSFVGKNGIGTMILNVDGKNRLQDIAKKKRLTKRSLINKVISGELL